MALPCSRCHSQVPDEALFCPACGAPLRVAPAEGAARPAPPAPQAAAAPHGPLACRGCGLQRAAQRDACDVCGASYADGGVAIPHDAGAFWVGVRCQFQCRSCGHLSPLDHLDTDGSVTCLRCGLDQIFDVASWRDGLDHAMRTGALAGEGAYRELGATRSSLELVQHAVVMKDGLMMTRSLRVASGPGVPLCRRCREPLHVEVAAGTATARCATCSAGMTCVLPPEAPPLCDAIRATLAEEDARDGREADVDAGDGSGPVAIRCPQCSAPLTVTGASTIVTCSYCQTSSRIPRSTLFRLGHDHPVAQVWWLQFARDAARHAIRAAPAPAPSAPEPAAPAPLPPRAPIPAPAAHPPPRSALPGAALGLAIALGVGLLGFGDDLARWRGSPPSGRTAPAAYDPRRFAPLDYLPAAAHLAEELAPGARLASFSFEPVTRDGRVDLTTRGRRRYAFAVAGRCILVEPGAHGVAATPAAAARCAGSGAAAPRCDLAAVWRLASTAGAHGTAARIEWRDRRWHVAPRDGGPELTLADRCAGR